MLREEIRRELKWSERWGCNYQPYIEDAVECLDELPVSKLDMEDDATLYIRFSRGLTASEAFRLAYWMHADEPGEYKDGDLEVRLWWD